MISDYDLHLLLRLVHLLGAATLFGTGLGIAFFMWMAHRTGNAAVVAATARVVVIADTAFTATAVVVQPLSGIALAHAVGYSLWDSWIVLSIALYLLVGACWLPVVWIQMRLRDLAREAARGGRPLSSRHGRPCAGHPRLDGASSNEVHSDEELPPEYHRLFRVWFILGWPAFAGVTAIFVLMIWKPQMW
jgi:uncharacterized membrane protein